MILENLSYYYVIFILWKPQAPWNYSLFVIQKITRNAESVWIILLLTVLTHIIIALFEFIYTPIIYSRTTLNIVNTYIKFS